MGAVQSVVECPKCKGFAEDITYYKSKSYYMHCERCGFSRTEEPVSDMSLEDAQKDSVVIETIDKGGFGIAMAGHLKYCLGNDSELEIRRAKGFMAFHEGRDGKRLLTVMKDGELVCLEGEMPLNYAEMLMKSEREGAESVFPERRFIPDELPGMPF